MSDLDSSLSLSDLSISDPESDDEEDLEEEPAPSTWDEVTSLPTACSQSESHSL